MPLTYRFNITPTVIGFCIFVNIDNTNISDIKNGRFRNGYKVKNVNATQTVKHWYDVCESALLYKAVNESSIGSIFALKAGYSYNDNPKQQIEISRPMDDKSVDELALEYSHTKPPKQIDFNEYQDN